MNPYRGFSPEVRSRSGRWLYAEIRAGRVPAGPPRCQACGQNAGVLEWHAEDYSEPFGPQTWAYGVCYPCHMALHCAPKNPAFWAFYKRVLATGRRSRPMATRNFPLFARVFLHLPSRGTIGQHLEQAPGVNMEVLAAIERGDSFPPA